MHGDEWSITDHLLAAVADAVSVANWQRASNATAANRPKPIPRPGHEDQPTNGEETLGKGSHSFAEIDELLPGVEKG